jgi:hypothetical protein
MRVSGPVKAPKNIAKAPAKPKAVSMFGDRAMKSPEDYETAQSVQGLGRQVSPYYEQQFARKGRQLKYDTGTNTYR